MRSPGLVLALLAMMGGALVCQTARAAPPVRIALQGAELGPFAYTHFCVTYPAECRISGAADTAMIELTPERRADLTTINTAVNRTIVPAPHAGRGTFDTWTIAPARGDCNDYAVTKRHDLLARGWPARALLLAEVVTGWGEHHLVLVARTSAGDLVLDNLSPQVRAWTAPNYTWVRAQMPDEPALWARIAAPDRRIAAWAAAPASATD